MERSITTVRLLQSATDSERSRVLRSVHFIIVQCHFTRLRKIMARYSVRFVLFNILVAFNINSSSQCPGLNSDAKAAYKSGEVSVDQSTPVTLDRIKAKLKESGVFDWQDATLTDRERKEVNKLFDAVEIMTSSRNRQPSNVQNMFSSMRVVERAVKKQLKEGQISDSLAAKFNWDKLYDNSPKAPNGTALSKRGDKYEGF